MRPQAYILGSGWREQSLAACLLVVPAVICPTHLWLTLEYGALDLFLSSPLWSVISSERQEVSLNIPLHCKIFVQDIGVQRICALSPK